MGAISTRSKIYAAILALLLLVFGIMKLIEVFNSDNEDPAAAQGGSLTFLFMSDTRAEPTDVDYSNYGKMLTKAIELGDPELVVFGGDSIYFGGDPLEWREFLKAAGNEFNERITASTVGDYDTHSLFPGQFDQPKDFEGGALGYSYSFAMDNLFFLMLDSCVITNNMTEIGPTAPPSGEVLEWLHETLYSEAAAGAEWQIVVMHHPMWSVTEDPIDAQRAEYMQEYFLPLMVDSGIDIILCGHQQYYSRTEYSADDIADIIAGSNAYNVVGREAAGDADDGVEDSSDNSSGSNENAAVMTGGTPEDSGIIQIMAASGNKGSSKLGNYYNVRKSGDAPNFVLLTADEKEIAITAHTPNGDVFDRFILTK